MYPLPKPLVPKNPERGLVVVVIGRISTVHQKLESIEAGYRIVEDFLKSCYQGMIEVIYLGEQASGMVAKRDTMVEVERLIEGGEVDLVIAEDLGRIYRNPRHQYEFVQDAVDRDIRLICIADKIDTADEHWETTLATATIRHGLAIPDTRRRVTSRSKEYFLRGGMVTKVRFGYRKLTREEAASGQFGPVGLRMARVDDATPVIRKMYRRVMEGENYTTIADWLNEEKIVPGPYCQCPWTAKLVSDYLSDPILQGIRTFGKTVSRQIYRTGKSKARRNPDPPLQQHYPSLAHLTAAEHSDLLAAIQHRSADRRRNRGRNHPRYNVARSKSIWPGQHARCGVCGRMFYKYDRDQLKCSGAHLRGDDRCWCHVQLDCELTRQTVLRWLLGYLDGEPNFRTMLVNTAWDEMQRQLQRGANGLAGVEADIARHRREAAALANAIALGGEIGALVERSKTTDAALKCAVATRETILAQQDQQSLATTREALEADLFECLLELARSSYEFADFMRRLFPKFEIRPIQAIDRPLVRPRAYLTFAPGALLGANAVEAEKTTEVVLDLFEPARHIALMPLCVAARQTDPKFSLKKIARSLGTSAPTVMLALKLRQQMQSQRLTEPYRLLTERPERVSRWK